jgi:L-asparaginase II
MPSNPFSPLIEVTRGPLVESIHFGALAIVDASGKLVAGVGDTNLVANLRSSAKPFQALPLVENGGVERFGLTDRELAIMCASHSGTDVHVDILKSAQAKIGVHETDLQCGVHRPGDEKTAQDMLQRGEEPTPYRHNCSGKHTGMLAQCVLDNQPIGDYLSNDHTIQKNILRTFAEITGMNARDVLVGIDGCSAPTFAIPLYNAALGYARLCDPAGLPEKRAQALRRIYHAMTTNPDMIAGPQRFDTELMQAGGGMIVSKGGAEGYQAFGLAPGALGPGSPALGITYKVIDGDSEGRARPVIAMSILRQLGALTPDQLEALKRYDARPIYNWRRLEVGVIRPAFTLEKSTA